MPAEHGFKFYLFYWKLTYLQIQARINYFFQQVKLNNSCRRDKEKISCTTYDQIRSVPSEPAESKNSPTLSNNTVCTASSCPVNCDCRPVATSYILTEPSLLAIARTEQLGSNATRLAGCGPRSTLASAPTVRTSHSFITPYESQEATVSPWKRISNRLITNESKRNYDWEYRTGTSCTAERRRRNADASNLCQAYIRIAEESRRYKIQRFRRFLSPLVQFVNMYFGLR